MAVAVEKIGPMLVGMNDPLVPVAMGVARRGQKAGVGVMVVAVVMAVHMLVRQCLMHMDVNVTLAQEEHECGEEEGRRHQMDKRERFPEKRGGKGNPDERRDREDDLGPAGAQALGGGDVQHDAGAVRTRAHQQSRGNDGRAYPQRSAA